MRISDWSSDVCSSDLDPEAILDQPAGRRIEHGVAARSGDTAAGDAPGRLDREAHLDFAAALRARRLPRIIAILDAPADQQDRKSTRLNSVTNAHLVCRLLLEKKKKPNKRSTPQTKKKQK